MPDLTFKYRPIQYIDDPFKGESRNIGVIAYQNGEAYCRLMGAKDDQIDTSVFASISKSAKQSEWVYGEWIEWFHVLVKNFKDRQESMMKRLDGLIYSEAGIILGNEAELDCAEQSNPEAAVDWLYSRLVTEPTLPRNELLKMRIESLIHTVGIDSRDGFEQSVELEFTPDGKVPVRVELPYVLTASPRAVFKIVRFQTGGAALVRQLNDAIFTFATVVEHGFADRKRCIVLTDRAPSGKDGALKRLEEFCVIVTATDADAADRLRSLLSA
jgi:hypothetical protein